jgi:hypothetical protein
VSPQAPSTWHSQGPQSPATTAKAEKTEAKQSPPTTAKAEKTEAKQSPPTKAKAEETEAKQSPLAKASPVLTRATRSTKVADKPRGPLADTNAGSGAPVRKSVRLRTRLQPRSEATAEGDPECNVQ